VICNNLKSFFCTVKLTIPGNIYRMLRFNSYKSISLLKITSKILEVTETRQVRKKKKSFSHCKSCLTESPGHEFEAVSPYLQEKILPRFIPFPYLIHVGASSTGSALFCLSLADSTNQKKLDLGGKTAPEQASTEPLPHPCGNDCSQGRDFF
jgi:hypothetical protein